MTIRRIAVARALAAVSVVFATKLAYAADCTPATAQSTCFDVDMAWVPAAPSRFMSIPSSMAVPARTGAVGFDVGYVSRPLELTTRSPDPGGRRVVAVDKVLGVALSGAYSPVANLELTATLPATLYREGSGLVGVTSQSGDPLPSLVLRDFRLGAGFTLAHSEGVATPWAVMTLLDLSLPTGAASSFAGARGLIVAPGFTGEVRHQHLFAALAVGARLRQAVDIGGTTIGTQLATNLGLGATFLDDRLLLALEGWLLPSLIQGSRTLPDGTLVATTSVPAEWMASIGTQLAGFSFKLGAGTGIPLSTTTTTHPGVASTTDTESAVGTPQFRAALVVRYVPQAAD